MKFETPLLGATLIKRYKRFLADVCLDDGQEITVHCPNTGKMTGCAEPGSRVWLLSSSNPKRKYRYTWELVEVAAQAQLACIHSARANKLVLEAINNGLIEELQGYERVLTEVRFGNNSRVDLLLESSDQSCYVEVKSVTLAMGGGLGLFPDTVSERASKHLRELIAMREAGHRAVLLFCVMHTGISAVRPASEIDPVYASTLAQALTAGVEAIAYGADISPDGLTLSHGLKFSLF